VGDSKQSIYRFRRADIGMYLRARERIGERVVLDSNFRTAASIVDWINHAFGALITPEPGSQPEFQPLRAVRPDPPSGPGVVRLGEQAHDPGLSAAQLRALEAADVVAAVQAALGQRWQVRDGSQPDGTPAWRDVTLPDIAVLLPARTSLPALEAALDEAGIGYHSEASSLVYRTSEVRELLAAARAVDDPSDELSLVTALRSRLFGCGDDDLWTWRRGGGSWNIVGRPPPSIPDTHPVAQAFTWLRRLHYDAAWLSPSEVLGRIVDGRRMFEVAVGDARPRDIWRRLRFVVDQARAWAESEHGGLRAYLAWVSRQGSDTARVAEAVLPETDSRSLRIMTIHAAKGMEFPVVIVAGMTTQPGGRRGGVEVLWPPRGGYEVRLRKDFATASFDTAAPVDEQMDEHERIRLLYVACTRARDHLVVSTHRRQPRSSAWRREELRPTSADLLAKSCAGAPAMVSLAPASTTPPVPPVADPPEPPPDHPQWSRQVRALRARTATPGAVAASHFEGTGARGAKGVARARTDGLGEPVDPGLAKDARDLELPPWQKGRYGTAIGRAVHAVLQTVDLATGAWLADAVAAQVLAEGVTGYADVVGQLVRSALDSQVVVRAAARAHWRETYVGTTLPSTGGDRVVEGIVDLLYRDDDGLVLVDYKTDAVPVAALPSRVDFYRPQMAVYATAIEAAVGEPIRRCVLLFLSPTGASAVEVGNLAEAIAQLPTVLPG
jgi:ATP-dependent exoDNAse (exonuclease V) beta subunit